MNHDSPRLGIPSDSTFSEPALEDAYHSCRFGVRLGNSSQDLLGRASRLNLSGRATVDSQDTIGRMAVTGKDDFQRKVRSSMRELQNDPKQTRSFY